MSNMPVPQQIYRHFKGNLYRIITLARHSETDEELVVYQALYGDYQVYARPVGSFLGKVDREKYPDASQEQRFELMQEVIQTPETDHAYDKKEDQVNKEPGKTLQEPEQEELNIDPLVLEYLDADSYGERLNILTALQHRITDEMINTMAIAIDHEIEEGDTQERYEELKNCLLTLERFECNRLR